MLFAALGTRVNRCLEPSQTCANSAICAYSVQNAAVMHLLQRAGTSKCSRQTITTPLASWPARRVRTRRCARGRQLFRRSKNAGRMARDRFCACAVRRGGSRFDALNTRASDWSQIVPSNDTESISEKSITDTRLYHFASTRYAAVRMDTPCSVSPKFDNTSKRLILLPIKFVDLIIRVASAHR